MLYESLSIRSRSCRPSRRPASARYSILMAFHFELSVVALIGIILLIGIVKKNAIMMIDFALHAERAAGMSAGGLDLPGGGAALPARS